ncbi:glycosyltransferase, partial [Acidobacteriota bacterium]
MKVLFISGGNKSIGNSSFTKEQADSLIRHGITVDSFLIHGKGFIGYLKNLPKLKRKIRKEDYDLVHAHYGFSGILAVLQRLCPTIVTFQGGDTHTLKNRTLSKIAIHLSALSIFVSQRLAEKARV